MDILDFEYVVVGSGIAGLMSAIRLAPHGRVGVLTKKDSAESATNYAQGGIACVVASDDSLQEHVSKTTSATRWRRATGCATSASCGPSSPPVRRASRSWSPSA